MPALKADISSSRLHYKQNLSW